jgi:SHS2 domain-containing protein
MSYAGTNVESPMQPHWEHFPHEADMGVRGIGSTKEAAFEGAALALTAVITDLESVAPTQSVPIACDAPDDELLLVDWLNALVYEIATRKMLFSRFAVRFNDHSLHATAWGEPIEVARHQPAVEVKGATYTELSVKRDEQGRWIAQCVVDV